MIFTIEALKAKVLIKLDMIKMVITVHVVMERSFEKQRPEIYEYLFSSILGAFSLEKIEHLTYNVFIDNSKNIDNSEKNNPPKSTNLKTIKADFSMYIPNGMMISMDGIQFVDYKDLKSGNPDFVPSIKYLDADLKQSENTTLPRYIFNPFVNEESKTPKKLFISYSSKNTAFMKEFLTHLKPLEREQLIKVWVDRMIETGTEWNDEIQKQLEEADMIIYLLSPHFIATPYIMDIEVKKGIEFYELSKSSSKPVKLYFIHLMDCNWSRAFSNYQQKLNNEELSKKLATIKDPDNHEAWMQVIKDLEEI